MRDESAEDIRLVLVPKSRTVDPGLLMESLFKLTELETRFPLNMNVLSRGKVPNVLSLKSVLSEWLEHRKEVLVRRSQHRLGEIEQRLEILGGYLIAYLNIDEVIRIIREEDEPKQVMMARWDADRQPGRSDPQHAAARPAQAGGVRDPQGVRRALGREEADRGAARLATPSSGRRSAGKSARCRKKFGPDTELGKRRTDVRRRARARSDRHPPRDDREGAGHRRRLRKGLAARAEGPSAATCRTLTFKEGDSLKLAFPAQTTDKILVFTTGGKFYTIGADRLPGGRGHGEPIRIIVDMENDQDIVTAFVHDPDAQAAAGLATRATASSCRRTRSSPTPARASR